MGQLASIRIIKKPPPANVMNKLITAEIAKQVSKVGDQHVREREKVTANFETDIEFSRKVSVTEKQVTLTVFVKNDKTPVNEDNASFTVGDLWNALDKTGIRPHAIPKRPDAKVLRFQWGGPGSYNPKTRPIARSGGPGSSSGPFIYRKRLKEHPGFKPRKFSEAINKRLRRQFEQAVDRGFRVGSNRAKGK